MALSDTYQAQIESLQNQISMQESVEAAEARKTAELKVQKANLEVRKAEAEAAEAKAAASGTTSSGWI